MLINGQKICIYIYIVLFKFCSNFICSNIGILLNEEFIYLIPINTVYTNFALTNALKSFSRA